MTAPVSPPSGTASPASTGDALGVLRERGFVRQSNDETGLSALLLREKLTYYVGFDATRDSLHCGSLMPIMAMAHLQRAGHRPIGLIGGGTTMVGDPSGKTEDRPMIPREEIVANGQGILGQLRRYLDLDGQRGLFLDNADWLLDLNYVAFLRDIGRHFRVNEMIRADAYRARLEREEGLSFIEFNYQLLQAYDFLCLNEQQGCALQMGGDDQWSNMLAGVDLVRRKHARQAYCLTFPLLTTARGEKMGKTAAGAVWLDAAKTPPYEFFQYWVNTDDRDVGRFLAYFTFLPMAEVNRMAALQGAELNAAKRVLAFEVTKLAHGEQAAQAAMDAAQAAFSGAGDESALPTTQLARAQFEAGIALVDLLTECKLAESKSAARRLIVQGGVHLNGSTRTDEKARIGTGDLDGEGVLRIRVGKKTHHRVVAA